MLYGDRILGFDTNFINEIDNINDFETIENKFLNKGHILIDQLKKFINKFLCQLTHLISNHGK